MAPEPPDGPGAAGLPRCQQIQKHAISETKFEFLGILIRRHFGKSGRAIGNANPPKRIAFDR